MRSSVLAVHTVGTKHQLLTLEACGGRPASLGFSLAGEGKPASLDSWLADSEEAAAVVRVAAALVVCKESNSHVSFGFFFQIRQA